MDLIEPEKPDGKLKRVPVEKCKRIEEAGETLPTRILRSASKKLTLADLPAVEVKKEEIKAASTSKKPDLCSSLDTTTEESIQGRKNPMLLSPIIRCVFRFLDIENVKNCRFVCHEWNSAGKQALSSRALIRFKKRTPVRLPIDFFSCFLDSAARFSSFEIYFGLWTMEELSKFFEEQQTSIKKLSFSFVQIENNSTTVKNFDISPWISRSPMVKSDVKCLTKLSIHTVDCAIPLHLLKHIKDLSLLSCRVNLESGIKIYPVKVSLESIAFYHDEILLPSIQMNDIVNISSAKEIYLDGYYFPGRGKTEITIDLSGNYCSLESLTLLQIETVSWETSKWDIRCMRLERMKVPPKQMTINELYYSTDVDGDFDLFALSPSIEKLGIGGEGQDVKITCSEPTNLENLKYFSVEVDFKADYSFLAHFMNCPQLANLKFSLEYVPDDDVPEIKLQMIPNAVKTLTLDRCLIDWLFNSYLYANFEKIVFFEIEINFERISKAKISVDDIIFICNDDAEQEVPKSVVNFFNYRNPWSLCKRFYIGKLKWDKMKLEDSVLNEHINTKSAFYVFENGEKGQALDEISFYQLADIPKHILKYCEI